MPKRAAYATPPGGWLIRGHGPNLCRPQCGGHAHHTSPTPIWISPVYALLRDAAAADSTLREHLAAEVDRRRGFQRTLVDLVHAHGPLRDGLTAEQAADTYSALADPDLYLLLTNHHSWTPGQYQAWLTDTLQRLLLPAP